jgi:hypothetical protein
VPLPFGLAEPQRQLQTETATDRIAIVDRCFAGTWRAFMPDSLRHDVTWGQRKGAAPGRAMKRVGTPANGIRDLIRRTPVQTLAAMRGPQIGRCAGQPGENAQRFHRRTRS